MTIDQLISEAENIYWDVEHGHMAIAANRIIAITEKEREKDIVLWAGLVKTGEPGLSLFKGHGEYESTMLFPVDYKMLKGKRGEIIFRESK